MMHGLLLATVTFFYAINPDVSLEACYQLVGAANPTCLAMTASPFIVEDLADDSSYDFWVKVDSVNSEKVRARTSKKPIAPLAVVVGN
jgi:hypothetical protein